MQDGYDSDQLDLMSEAKDLDLLRVLLADLHDGLRGRLTRLRYLTDLGATLGRNGTMLYGGYAAMLAYSEARSSFIAGNFIATVTLCQGLAEHLLASFLACEMDLPKRVHFRETIQLGVQQGLLTADDQRDLLRMSALRNPLMHYQHFDHPGHLERRVAEANERVASLVESDAYFAVAVATRLLAKSEFRVD